MTAIVPAVSDYAPKRPVRRGDAALSNVASAAADVIATAAAETRLVAEQIARRGAEPIAKEIASAVLADDDATLRLANCTIAAVDQIGEDSAAEIEKTADALIEGANEIAANLRQLATAIRDHSKTAHEHVTGFCNRATTVLTTVRDLQCQLTANGQDARH